MLGDWWEVKVKKLSWISWLLILDQQFPVEPPNNMSQNFPGISNSQFQPLAVWHSKRKVVMSPFLEKLWKTHIHFLTHRWASPLNRSGVATSPQHASAFCLHQCYDSKSMADVRSFLPLRQPSVPLKQADAASPTSFWSWLKEISFKTRSLSTPHFSSFLRIPASDQDLSQSFHGIKWPSHHTMQIQIITIFKHRLAIICKH